MSLCWRSWLTTLVSFLYLQVTRLLAVLPSIGLGAIHASCSERLTPELPSYTSPQSSCLFGRPPTAQAERLSGMPYTPPSHRSPSASAPTSPDASRRPSLVSGGSRPVLPRSASYLTRHRRTPSAVGAPDGAASQPSPDATSDDLKSLVSSRSVRQSPPPVTSDRGMPQGAILSPPESASNSDDDDLPQMRGRQIENLKELKELHEAVSQLPRHRESSPTRPDAGDLLVLPSQSEGIHHSFSASALDDMAHAGRKISHTRSVTEPHILISKSADNSLTGSDDESEEPLKKPQMVRKKSGELVRPALRPASRRRPSSMPGTPTFSKAVHFDSHLEHVRHFLQVDRPLAVSAGSSPNENYDSDNEYPFPGDERRNTRNPPYEWEIIVTNFPVETPARKALPVRLERVWLSNDQKCLIGSVVVTNLAFQKYVTCRFTLDYWKTTSEVAGDYVTEVGRRDLPDQHDRFNFSIKLSDLANLESKTLYFCIRYNVNGQEFWDNNSGTNFQIDFKKKHLPMNGKNNFQGASSRPLSSLPRSNRRSPGPDARPRSMPASSDEFGENQKINFDQSLHEYLGETGTSLRLKGVKSSTNLPSDNLSSRLSAPSGQAFANRYDFGASLTAAVQAAKDAMGNKPDGLYMKPHRKANVQIATANTGKPLAKDTGSPVPGSSPVKSAAPATASAPATSGVQSPGSGSISSASYEELVNKYCFVCTSGSSSTR